MREVRTPLHQNGGNQIVFRPTWKSVTTILGALVAIIVFAAGAYVFYCDVKQMQEDYPVFKAASVETHREIGYEQKSQRILLEAVVKEIMPENADLIIEQSKVKRGEEI